MNWTLFILMLINFPLVFSSTSCSIFPSLNCSCFQSNIDLNTSSSIKTYSHLYCQGNSLTEKTFRSPFGKDFKHQNHFRTVSIEFIHENRIEIQSNHFDSLAMLFSETDFDVPIDIYLRFVGFDHIAFQEHSLTSAIFQRKHQNRRLWIHLIPARSNLTQSELDNETLTDVENQFNFSSNCFSGLTVSQLNLHIYTVRERFPLKYSFEQIFNNTKIGELHFHGAIIRPGSLAMIQSFHGVIRSLTLHRHVDTIDANTFPHYSQVHSYTIHSIEAHSMNLSSFLDSHTNLRGLEIIKPRFEVSIDQFIPTLDSLTLDIQHITKKTLLIARHIYNFKLGSNLRTIHPEIFDLLSRRLHHLDLSQVDLSQMTSDSRCSLIKYLSKHSHDQLNIIYPQMKSLNECDCTQIFLNYLQSKTLNSNDSTCSKLCQLNDCPTISEYFKEKYPVDTQLNEIINVKDEPLSAVEIISDSVDDDMINYLINQTTDQERNETQRRPIVIDLGNISTLENIQEYDDSFTPKVFEPLTNQIESFSWFSFSIGVAVVVLLLLILSLIIVLVIKYRKQHNFKPVPVYV